MRTLTRTICGALLMLLMILLVRVLCEAVISSSAYNTLIDGLFRLSDSLGELLCKVAGV